MESQDGLPLAFVERLRQQFPDDVEEILSTFHQRPPVIRVNTLFTTVQQVVKVFQDEGITIEEIPVLPSSFMVQNADRRRITDLPIYQQGWVYLQSLASQLVVKALDPQPG